MATPVYVVGHKNPDNDSIAAAVGYANLKNQLAARECEANPDACVCEYIPARLGPLPQESEAILNEFGVEAPVYIDALEPGAQVILVDHNEPAQAADGLDSATILEIIDHHRISELTTAQPITFINLPLGSTATIVTLIYKSCGVEISKPMAAVLLSAILTDTVITKSPTCTDTDKAVIEELAAIIGEEPIAYGLRIFESRGGDADMDVETICTADSKEFKVGDSTILIAQHETVTLQALMQREPEMRAFIADLCQKNGYEFVLLLATDIIEEGSNFIVEGNHERVDRVFDIDSSAAVWMPGVLSRKKQVAAPLLES